MHRTIVFLVSVGIFAWTSLGFAQMSSPNYIIRWDTISTGGSDTSESAGYELRDTIGNTAIGDSDSATYQLRGGYRQGVFDQVLTFDVFAQQIGSDRVATAVVGSTITVDSTVGLSVDDFILLIQDEGASQVSAIGRVVSIGVGTITVDELKDGGVAPVIDGANDVVYELLGTAADLGDLDPAEVRTRVVGFNVTSDVDNGYIVQVLDDGDLRDGSMTINDVADGTVSAGAEEYGGRSSDASLANSTFDTADTAFTTAFQDVATESVTSFESRNFVTLKASISGSTVTGTYVQALSFILSGNF